MQEQRDKTLERFTAGWEGSNGDNKAPYNSYSGIKLQLK